MNILLIQADQQRRDHIGVYGNGVVRTPAVDRLAGEGVVFDHAFTPCPLCAPARASLLTGKRPMKHGILFNVESGSVAGRDFAGAHATLGDLVTGRGHRAIHCGKWHVGTSLSPAECGFEGIYYPGYGYPDKHPHYRAYLEGMGAEFRLKDEVYSRRPDGSDKYCLSAILDAPEEAAEPCYLVTQAIEAMRSAVREGKPFFVRVDFWGPHAPYILPERYARMYDPDALEPWPNFDDDLAGKPEIQRAYRRYWGLEGSTWRDWSRLVAMCYGYVTLIDDQVARLVSTLDELGVAGDTAVFHTSDHGGMVGAHTLEDKGPYLYDEVIRVPLIARVPGMSGGLRSDAAVYNMDLMPTVLDLAGCELPGDIDALSLVPILRGESESVRPPDEPICVEFHGHQTPYEQRLVRTRNAKYVFNAPESDELYDLERDPHELHNVAGDPAYAGALEEMRQLLRQHMIDSRDPLLPFFEGSRLASPVRHSPTGRIEAL